MAESPVRARIKRTREAQLRPLMLDVCEHLPERHLAVELGVLRGAATAVFKMAFRRVIAVDAWDVKVYDTAFTTEWSEIASKDQNYFDREKRWFYGTVGWMPGIDVIQASTKEAAIMFDEGGVQFLYIDAGHAYENVYEDYSSWVNNMTDGRRVIAGHDYNDHFYGIKRAVNEIFRGEKIHTYPDSSWAVYL